MKAGFPHHFVEGRVCVGAPGSVVTLRALLAPLGPLVRSTLLAQSPFLHDVENDPLSNFGLQQGPEFLAFSDALPRLYVAASQECIDHIWLPELIEPEMRFLQAFLKFAFAQAFPKLWAVDVGAPSGPNPPADWHVAQPHRVLINH